MQDKIRLADGSHNSDIDSFRRYVPRPMTRTRARPPRCCRRSLPAWEGRWQDSEARIAGFSWTRTQSDSPEVGPSHPAADFTLARWPLQVECPITGMMVTGLASLKPVPASL